MQIKLIKYIFARDCLKDVKPYDGILELLSNLKSMNIKTVVLSKKSQACVEKNIYTIIGDGDFDSIYGERPGIPKKPDPTALNIIIKEL